jgi:phospholipid transport system substrate-binding protein
MIRAVSRRLLIAAVPATVATIARAQGSDPTAPIRALNDALLQIMHAGSKTPFGERARIFTPAIQAAFDLATILKTSVGPRWTSLPAAQQSELTELFRRYTVASYVANFDGFSGEKFEVEPRTRAIGADQVVATRIVPTSGDPTRIDYVMRLSGGAWKAVDVLLDGSISRVAVQRSDFRALIGGGDATKLIASLRAKTATLESGG